MTETRKPGLFGRLRERIASSTTGLREHLTGLAAYGAIDDAFWEELEETLMSADLGPDVGLRLAADTFRAGAIEQLRLWADRLGSDFVSSEPGSDPASVAFAAVEAGLARGVSAVIIDTAGRLHTQSNLMEELRKVNRTIGKALPGAPHETLLVIDAAIGQNSIQQARVFNEALPLTGLVVAKLDGSAKGGVILGLEEQFGVPVKLIGTGEQPGDLEPFDPQAYVESLFEAAA